jgi:O-antigen/teichoic acid export membrane protein
VATAPVAKQTDLSGRDRAAWNVVSSWAGHMVFVVSGFVMPRMIDHYVGQTSLGIWDFSWSLVNYFGLAGLGIGSSVNRHVAMYRSKGESDKLNTAVSSVMCMQWMIAAVIGVLTFGIVMLLPMLFSHRLGDHMTEARWVVAMLGCSLAVQMAFDFYRGVITGCHRWDLHNAINAAAYAGTVAGMIVALHQGGGLRSLAVIYLSFTVLTELLRMGVARGVCPELRLRVSAATREQSKQMLIFGTKRIVMGLPPLILNQSTSLLIASHLGPAMLAVYSRPMGLMRSAQTFIDKFAFVTTPTAAALQQSGDSHQVRDFLVRSTQFAVAIAAPLVLFFGIQGPSILAMWMGSQYSEGAVVLLAMAIALFLPMTQQPAMSILVGLNKHGKLGVFTVTTAVAGLCVGILAAHLFGLTLTGAALVATLPLALANGVVLPIYACRTVHQSLRAFVGKAYLVPLSLCIPFAIVLLAVRVVIHRPMMSLLVSAVAGGISLLPAAWILAPAKIRDRLQSFVNRT